MVKIITIPDPTKQHEKTPVYVDKAVTVKDEKGKDVQTTQKVMLTTGTGEATKVVRYSELDKLITDAKKVAGKTELATGVSIASVEAKFDKAKPESHGVWGLGCPHNCGRFWEFKPNDKLDGFVPKDPVAWEPKSPKVIEQTEVDVTPTVYEKDGITPSEEQPKERIMKTYYLIDTRYDEPVHALQLEWVDEIPVTHGYLNWLPQPDGSTLFTCDRCMKEVKLV